MQSDYSAEMINFLILILIGLTPFLLGVIFRLYSPKKINPWAGFRTRVAISSQVLWDESNRVGALLFIKIGLLSMAFGVFFFALGLADYFWVLSALTLVVVIASIFYVNRHLRKFQKSLK